MPYKEVNNMTIRTLHLVQLIAMFASILLIIIALCVLIKKKDIRKSIKRTTGIIIAFLFVGNLAFGIWANTFIRTAERHGMYDTSNTVTEVMEYIGKTPIEDTLPDDLTDTLIIYYRFDCEDCHNVYDDLVKEVARFEEKTGDKIYWVSTRSDQGKQLRETYSVASVPSFMYIKDPDAPMPYYLEPVYYKEGDGTQFYPVAWDKILEIRDQYTSKTKFAE